MTTLLVTLALLFIVVLSGYVAGWYDCKRYYGKQETKVYVSGDLPGVYLYDTQNNTWSKRA